MNLQFRIDDEEIAVRVERDDEDWRLITDGREIPLQARAVGGGCWIVETHQGRRRLWVAVQGDERLVFCDGRVHRLRLPDPEHADQDAAGSVGPDLAADMPGKVVRILVEPGAAVQAGQPVIIMESMKMETELSAEVAGRVTVVHVADGQVVAQGDPLVDIEPDAGAEAE